MFVVAVVVVCVIVNDVVVPAVTCVISGAYDRPMHVSFVLRFGHYRAHSIKKTHEGQCGFLLLQKTCKKL